MQVLNLYNDMVPNTGSALITLSLVGPNTTFASTDLGSGVAEQQMIGYTVVKRDLTGKGISTLKLGLKSPAYRETTTVVGGTSSVNRIVKGQMSAFIDIKIPSHVTAADRLAFAKELCGFIGSLAVRETIHTLSPVTES